MNTSEAIPLFYEGYGNSDKPYGYITNISFDNDGRYTGGYNPSSWFGIKVELKNLKSGHRYVFNNESKILGSYLLINGRLTSDFTVR